MTSARVWRAYLDGACSDNHKADASTRRGGYGIWFEPQQQEVEEEQEEARRQEESEEKQTQEEKEEKEKEWQFSGPLPAPPAATNNRAELLSLITVFELWFDNRLPASAVDRLDIVMDNRYAVDIATQWLPAWRRRNFIKADGKPVQNRDLVMRFDALLQRARNEGRDFSITWTPAHEKEPAGVDKRSMVWRDWYGNDRADQLARAAAAALSTTTSSAATSAKETKVVAASVNKKTI